MYKNECLHEICTTSLQCFCMSVSPGILINMETKPLPSKEKVMSYEEKSVGSTPFFKCEACPYMALAEDDIKFHLFTVHPDLAKSNGLADNIQINCPGCSSVFDAEETLRTHLRNHHKMGIKDVRKMIKSLVQIALKNTKLKKEDKTHDVVPKCPQHEIAEVKIPQVIEIAPDIMARNNSSMPKGVAFISMEELNKMSAPNFEKIDPKEVIQEASINIVYTNEVSTQYVNVSDTGPLSTSCNVPPDLISSIPQAAVDSNISSPTNMKDKESFTTNPNPLGVLHPQSQAGLITYSCKYNDNEVKSATEMESTLSCSIGNCHFHFKDEKNLLYHRKCHQNGKLQCQECGHISLGVDGLHTHLWKVHAIDMELPTCEICGFKTFRKNRLLSIHMKCHGTIKEYKCVICSKNFKNANQLSKHKAIHKRNGEHVCHICHLEFTNERRLKTHIAAVHDKVKPFKCSHCEYTSARKSELKLHLRSHSGDKPYACDECTYRSSDHNAMRRHKKLHSKQSMYKCKYCPYTTIQSTMFTSHMISMHPTVNSDVHCCPYCSFKSVNKDKYVVHLTTHTDKEGISLLIEMTKSVKANKPSWTIPSETSEKPKEETKLPHDQTMETSPKTVNAIPIEVYDCDSLSESMAQDYPKNFCTTPSTDAQQPDFNNQVLVTDLSKDDNNSDCLISESSNDTLIERHQYAPQMPLQMSYDTTETNLHFLNPAASIEQGLLQNNNVSSLAPNHASMNSSMSNNIMCNFPIRLPPVPQISVRNNIMVKAIDKIQLPMSKVTGPIIKPTQILPVPSSIHSPINISNEPDGVPRKKAKISVKSNLILKGPDQVNMFHSQQKMAFRRLEDNERFGLGGPVTFNNLITTQFMQMQPEPTLSESPSSIIPYPQENMLEDAATTPVDNEMNSNAQIFSFNQQMNVNTMTMLPPSEKIQTNDPSYIKLEATIKQNTQSPSLERMCNANLMNNQAMNCEYKASPPLEDIHKNMSEIKNEVKSDTFYNLTLNNSTANPPIIDQYLIDNIIPDQYSTHLDLSAVVLPEDSDQQNDVIEIDDNSDDNKLLPRFDMNFPLESLYLMHNDFHFLDNEPPSNNMAVEVPVSEMNRMVAEVPILNQKDSMEMVSQDNSANGEFSTFIQGKKDPMMNTSLRGSTNKINVKNIELMKN